MSDCFKSGQKVEIISDGARELVFIDGKRFAFVTSIETPHEIGDVSNRVRVEFIASEVLSRHVSPEEFKARQKETTWKITGQPESLRTGEDAEREAPWVPLGRCFFCK